MDEAEGRKAAAARTAPSARSRSAFNLFSMYKPHQGKQIRLWSGVGAGVILLGAWNWMYEKLQVPFSQTGEWAAVATSLAICGAVALLVWYLIGVNRSSADFLIATEGEMKKVTWSSRKEVWGATKVVIGMVIFLTIGLFTVDLFFTWFFRLIGVLKTPF